MGAVGDGGGGLTAQIEGHRIRRADQRAFDFAQCSVDQAQQASGFGEFVAERQQRLVHLDGVLAQMRVEAMQAKAQRHVVPFPVARGPGQFLFCHVGQFGQDAIVPAGVEGQEARELAFELRVQRLEVRCFRA